MTTEELRAVMERHKSDRHHSTQCCVLDEHYDHVWPCETYKLASALLKAQAVVEAARDAEGLLREMHLPTQGHAPQDCPRRTDFCEAACSLHSALAEYDKEVTG